LACGGNRNGEYDGLVVRDTVINSEWKTFGQQPVVAEHYAVHSRKIGQ